MAAGVAMIHYITVVGASAEWDQECSQNSPRQQGEEIEHVALTAESM